MDKQALRKGMVVRGRLGKPVGTVLLTTDDGFVVEKGRFSMEDWLLPYGWIADVDGDVVRLGKSADELERDEHPEVLPPHRVSPYAELEPRGDAPSEKPSRRRR